MSLDAMVLDPVAVAAGGMGIPSYNYERPARSARSSGLVSNASETSKSGSGRLERAVNIAKRAMTLNLTKNEMAVDAAMNHLESAYSSSGPISGSEVWSLEKGFNMSRASKRALEARIAERGITIDGTIKNAKQYADNEGAAGWVQHKVNRIIDALPGSSYMGRLELHKNDKGRFGLKENLGLSAISPGYMALGTAALVAGMPALAAAYAPGMTSASVGTSLASYAKFSTAMAAGAGLSDFMSSSDNNSVSWAGKYVAMPASYLAIGLTSGMGGAYALTRGGIIAGQSVFARKGSPKYAGLARSAGLMFAIGAGLGSVLYSSHLFAGEPGSGDVGAPTLFGPHHGDTTTGPMHGSTAGPLNSRTVNIADLPVTSGVVSGNLHHSLMNAGGNTLDFEGHSGHIYSDMPQHTPGHVPSGDAPVVTHEPTTVISGRDNCTGLTDSQVYARYIPGKDIIWHSNGTGVSDYNELKLHAHGNEFSISHFDMDRINRINHSTDRPSMALNRNDLSIEDLVLRVGVDTNRNGRWDSGDAWFHGRFSADGTLDTLYYENSNGALEAVNASAFIHGHNVASGVYAQVDFFDAQNCTTHSFATAMRGGRYYVPTSEITPPARGGCGPSNCIKPEPSHLHGPGPGPAPAPSDGSGHSPPPDTAGYDRPPTEWRGERTWTGEGSNHKMIPLIREPNPNNPGDASALVHGVNNRGLVQLDEIDRIRGVHDGQVMSIYHEGGDGLMNTDQQMLPATMRPTTGNVLGLNHNYKGVKHPENYWHDTHSDGTLRWQDTRPEWVQRLAPREQAVIHNDQNEAYIPRNHNRLWDQAGGMHNQRIRSDHNPNNLVIVSDRPNPSNPSGDRLYDVDGANVGISRAREQTIGEVKATVPAYFAGKYLGPTSAASSSSSSTSAPEGLFMNNPGGAAYGPK